MRAELILTGGRVWAGWNLPAATAVAIAGGKILAVGSDAGIAALAGPGTPRIELAGRLVTPGLIDSHIHMTWYGSGLRDLSLWQTTTLDQLLSQVRQRAEAAPRGTWIKANGHDEERLDVGRHPTRDELDRAAPDHPVYLIRRCGHVFLCNSMALHLAGIGDDTQPPSGGVIERAGGRATGLIAETTREWIKRAQPARSHEDLVEAIRAGSRTLSKAGITGVMEAGVGRITGSIAEYDAFRAVAADRSLSVRVDMAITADAAGILPQLIARGVAYGDGCELAWVGPAKLYADGSAGGRTAAMFEPYAGSDARGVLIYEQMETLAAQMTACRRAGFQVAIHAIGDRAIEQVLQAFDQAQRAVPCSLPPNRIEHGGFMNPAQIRRAVLLGLVVSPQPVFVRDVGDSYVTALGPERAQHAYPMRDWIDAGLLPAAGTDAPVTQPDPLANLLAMVQRRTRSGTVVGPDQRISIDEALRAYTESGAVAQGKGDRRGRLVPGMDADIAVFSQDFRADPEGLLTGTACDLTLLGGRPVWDRLGCCPVGETLG